MRKLTKLGVAVGAAAGLMVGGASVGGAMASDGGNLSPDTNARVLAASTSAQRVFAVVHEDGTPGRGRGFQSSQSTSTGVYTVTFNRQINKCIWQGTIGQGNFEGSSGPGEISIAGRNGTKNALYVTTFNSAGAAQNRPFLVLVVCS